ncbi:hypothetical protein ACP3T3_09500 [Chryseobacterium sp. CBSDS_008]|uniref:hypothetical protein n=1 Tax=Chryseobacterium sp. CBSDS_008 TaxID=3415265 RepID=UPI003CF292A6
MKNICIILLAFLFSCKTNTAPSKSITFKAAENYFVKNTYRVGKPVEKVITSKKEFDEIFGMAAYMGNKGMPTAIDFSKEQVIAIMLPITNTSTEIFPLKLVNTKTDEAEFFYKIKTGEKLSYDIKPKLLLIINKDYKTIHFNKED